MTASVRPPSAPATGPYQVCPLMTPEQFEDLKFDIAQRGVVTPIDVDERGVVIDGHHRLRACHELGITNYPTFVRIGLSEVEKRTYARQANQLRRHLTPAQQRDLVAGQLRDTPHWADARIARVLGVSDKTVRAARRRLEATSEIPRLDRVEGADGRTRASVQPARAIFVPNAGEVGFDDLVRLAQQAAVLAPDEARAFWTKHSIAVVRAEAPDPFAACSEAEARTWHLFTLFLVREYGYTVDGAAAHVEWVIARFPTVAEWLGAPGAPWRRSVGMRDVPSRVIRAWETFAAAQHDRTSAEVIAELCALNPGDWSER
jgi:hypothetical protein